MEKGGRDNRGEEMMTLGGAQQPADPSMDWVWLYNFSACQGTPAKVTNQAAFILPARNPKASGPKTSGLGKEELNLDQMPVAGRPPLGSQRTGSSQ
jgi:hypothetical protein